MRRVLLAAVMVLAAAACGPPADGGGASDAPASGPYAGEWRLVSGKGPTGKIPVPGEVTLTVEGSELTGRSACNHYQAAASIDGSVLSVTGMGGTAMGCPGKRTVAEERYSAALQAADTIQLHGKRLRISGPGVDLLFAKLEPPQPAAFEGTKWKLTTLMIGRGPDGTAMSTEAPASLAFHAGGSLTGTTGCVDLTGQWEREADIVTVRGLPEGDFDCQRGGQQTDHLLKILRAPFTAEILGRQLDLQQVDGNLGAGYAAN